MKPEIVEIPKANKTREMMDDLCKLMEKWELPPTGPRIADGFLSIVLNDTIQFNSKWKDNPFAYDFSNAFFWAIAGQLRRYRPELDGIELNELL